MKDEPQNTPPAETPAVKPKSDVWQRPAIKVIQLASSGNHVAPGADGSGHS